MAKGKRKGGVKKKAAGKKKATTKKKAKKKVKRSAMKYDANGKKLGRIGKRRTKRTPGSRDASKGERSSRLTYLVRAPSKGGHKVLMTLREYCTQKDLNYATIITRLFRAKGDDPITHMIELPLNHPALLAGHYERTPKKRSMRDAVAAAPIPGTIPAVKAVEDPPHEVIVAKDGVDVSELMDPEEMKSEVITPEVVDEMEGLDLITSNERLSWEQPELPAHGGVP